MCFFGLMRRRGGAGNLIVNKWIGATVKNFNKNFNNM